MSIDQSRGRDQETGAYHDGSQTCVGEVDVQTSGDHADGSRVVDRPLHVGLGEGHGGARDLAVRGLDGEGPDDLADDLDVLRLEGREAVQEVVSKYNGVHCGKGLERFVRFGFGAWKAGMVQ